MATKTVAWNSGSGVITLTYTGQGNGSVSVKSDANDSFDARSQNLNIVTTEGSPEKAVQVLVKQAGKPLGWTTKDFGYTGSVQDVTLPKGRYKLQCWGAQGGDTSSYSGEGSYGGYSEGILTLTETTTLYIFVGGRGGSSGNGGWNGGGSSTGYSSYSSGDEYGESWPACGGGATDISTVTSSMGYSNGRTNRSAASLLARCIVAGGGAGASARHTIETTTVAPSTNMFNKNNVESVDNMVVMTSTKKFNSMSKGVIFLLPFTVSTGDTVSAKLFQDYSQLGIEAMYVVEYNGNIDTGESIDTLGYSALPARNGSYNNAFAGTNSKVCLAVHFVDNANKLAYIDAVIECLMVCKNTSPMWPSAYEEYREGYTEEVESESSSSASQQGGGTSGKGTYGGTQSSAGSGGGFGYGANQETTNYMYCGGAGGGGWYGGGTYHADGSTDVIYDGSGGSGFVNIAANASYRPSGYTGLQLDSGSTIAGNSSHPSINGGTEIGHSGNGYARITVL